MVIQALRSSLLLCALLTLLSGCGARTGLGWFERASSDAGLGPAPDVFGPFPCTYGIVGRPQPVFPEPPHSVWPRADWGHDQIAVTFTTADSTFYPDFAESLLCLTHHDWDYACGYLTFFNPVIMGPTPIVATEEGWSTCLTIGTEPADAFPVIINFTPDGTPTDELDPGLYGRACVDMVSTLGHLYIVTRPTYATGQYEIFEVDPHGSEPDLVLGPLLDLESWQPGGISADEGVVAATYSDGRSVNLNRLDRSAEDVTITAEGGAWIASSVVALREHIGGLFWVTYDDRGTSLNFAIADLDRGLVTEASEVHRTDAWIVGHTAIAVNEGFILAWTEQGSEARVVAVAVRLEEWEPQFWSELVYHDGPDYSVDPGAGGPVLTYDDHSGYIGFSLWSDEIEHMQVVMQQLDCHR